MGLTRELEKRVYDRGVRSTGGPGLGPGNRVADGNRVNGWIHGPVVRTLEEEVVDNGVFIHPGLIFEVRAAAAVPL